MATEPNSKVKHKNPKFKESYDEYSTWEDGQERQNSRKKLSQKSRWKNNAREKW